MKSKIFLIPLVLTSLFCFNFAQAQDSTIEKVSLKTAYVPRGFDNVNRVQVTVEGVLVNSCYRVGPKQVQVVDGKIIINQGAYHYNKGLCADIVIPYNETLDLGILSVGNYQIIDGASGAVLGVLPVAPAPRKSPETYPDDYLYAPVSDASLVLVGSLKRVVISGAFTDNCTRFSEIRANAYGNVIEILPITTRAKTGCTHGLHPFQITRTITVPNGHYLLYVRSLSGNAINKMIDVYDGSNP